MMCHEAHGILQAFCIYPVNTRAQGASSEIHAFNNHSRRLALSFTGWESVQEEETRRANPLEKISKRGTRHTGVHLGCNTHDPSYLEPNTFYPTPSTFTGASGALFRLSIGIFSLKTYQLRSHSEALLFCHADSEKKAFRGRKIVCFFFDHFQEFCFVSFFPLFSNLFRSLFQAIFFLYFSRDQ